MASDPTFDRWKAGVSGNSLLPYKFVGNSHEFIRQTGIPAHPCTPGQAGRRLWSNDDDDDDEDKFYSGNELTAAGFPHLGFPLGAEHSQPTRGWSLLRKRKKMMMMVMIVHNFKLIMMMKM